MTTTAAPVTYLAPPDRRLARPFRRILVTGSRTWRDTPTIRHALAAVWHPDALLFTGHCDEGADLLAWQCWSAWGGRVEHWDADWVGPCGSGCPPGHRIYRRGRWICPRAGLVRNAAMVATSPDIVVAFIHRGSPGASHCLRTALKAGVTATVYRTDHQPPEWAVV